MKRIAPALVPVACLLVSEAAWVDVMFRQTESGWAAVTQLVGILAALFGVMLVAAHTIDRVDRRAGLTILWAGAIFFRLTLIPAGIEGPKLAGLLDDVRGTRVAYERYLLYDDDLWRFLWEGHLAATGGDPYRTSPDDAWTSPIEEKHPTHAEWEEIQDRVNHPAFASIYPPFAQLLFRTSHAIAPGSVASWKLIITAADLATIAVLVLMARSISIPLSAVLLYAWNPLVIKVGAGSGHFDTFIGLALVLTAWFFLRRKRAAAAVAFASAVLIKLSPLVLLPLVACRLGLRALVLCLSVLAIPFHLAGSSLPNYLSNLASFGKEWTFNAGPYRALIALTGSDEAARMMSGVIVISIVLVATWRDRIAVGFEERAANVMGATLLAGPIVMPWYLLWFLPLAAASAQKFWIWFSLLVLSALLIMADGTEYPLVLAIEYGLAAVLLLKNVSWISPQMIPATLSRKESK